MSEHEVILAALACALAAVLAPACPWWAVVAVLALAILSQRPAVLIIALALAVATLAAHAEAGLTTVPHRVTGIASVATDPEVRPGGLVVEFRIEGRRYRSFVSDDVAVALQHAYVGQEVAIVGHVGSLRGPWEWRASLHLSGRLDVASARVVDAGPWWWTSAEWMHRTVTDGLRSFDDDERALFLGIVFGDDRGQSSVEQFRFRSSGLSHLTAVSGQNVAFVLVAASPLLRRLRLRARWVCTLALLGWFALVTRVEPSVMRAVAMAVVASTAAWRGRYVSGLRVVSVAVIGLLLVDPLLVWSLGFRLSVAASVSLVVLARPLARCLPGPRVVAEAVAVSLAAQVGTAPLLVMLAGSVPALGPVFNVVAVPVAGLLMVWGVVTGPLAGLVGEPLAMLLGWPSRWMVRWLSWVASIGADPSWPRLGLLGSLAMAAVVIVLVGRDRLRSERTVGPLVRVASVVVLLVGSVCIGVDGSGVLVGSSFVDGAATVWVDGGAAVMTIGAGTDEATALSLLLRCRCSRLDVVVVTGGGRTSSAIVYDLRQVADVRTVLATQPGTIRDTRRLVPGTIEVGHLRVVVEQGVGGTRVTSAA